MVIFHRHYVGLCGCFPVKLTHITRTTAGSRCTCMTRKFSLKYLQKSGNSEWNGKISVCCWQQQLCSVGGDRSIFRQTNNCLTHQLTTSAGKSIVLQRCTFDQWQWIKLESILSCVVISLDRSRERQNVSWRTWSWGITVHQPHRLPQEEKELEMQSAALKWYVEFDHWIQQSSARVANSL